MKTTTLRAIAPALFLVILTPVLLRGQAEINPDHFDTPNGATMSGRKIAASQRILPFQGRLLLPFDVRYAGVGLPPGSYSLSVRRLGKQNVITLTPTKNADRAQSIEVKVTSRSSTQAPTALLAERTGRQRTLRGICFPESAISLPLPTGKKAATLRNTEALPVSSTRRVFSSGDGS